MFSMNLDSGQAMAKMRRWRKQIAGVGNLTASIVPIDAIRHLSDARGENLLKKAPAAAMQAAKRSAIPALKAAMQARGIDRGKLAFRAWANAYIDELWQAVRAGGWGRVRDTTLTRKRLTSARTQGNPSTYGVRHGWADEQKRKIEVK